MATFLLPVGGKRPVICPKILKKSQKIPESRAEMRRVSVAEGAAIAAAPTDDVSIGPLVVSYLMQDHVMGLQEQAAGKLLAGVAPGAIPLILISTHTAGTLSGDSLLAIGLMNAIMFPTIFSLASEKLGPRAADGSGILNVAIFGGAVVPLAAGALADLTGHPGLALLLPAACYAIIAAFGLYARRPAPDPVNRIA